MKKIVLILILGSSTTLFAQNSLTYSKVITTDSVGKNAIYVAVKDWLASTYKSAKDVIQMDDKDAGLIIGKANFDYSYGGLIYACYSGYIDYSIKIQVKDNRYKVEVTGFNHIVQSGKGKNCELGLITTDEVHSTKGGQKNYDNKVWADIKIKAEEYSNTIFLSLENKTKDLKKASDNGNW